MDRESTLDLLKLCGIKKTTDNPPGHLKYYETDREILVGKIVNGKRSCFTFKFDADGRIIGSDKGFVGDV